jgi:hypothetical protein
MNRTDMIDNSVIKRYTDEYQLTIIRRRRSEYLPQKEG